MARLKPCPTSEVAAARWFILRRSSFKQQVPPLRSSALRIRFGRDDNLFSPAIFFKKPQTWDGVSVLHLIFEEVQIGRPTSEVVAARWFILRRSSLNSRSLHCAHPLCGFASVGMTIHLRPLFRKPHS